jgi:hypothetical protein
MKPGRPRVGEKGTPVLREALTRFRDGEQERGVDGGQYDVGPVALLSRPGGADALSISIRVCSARTA